MVSQLHLCWLIQHTFNYRLHKESDAKMKCRNGGIASKAKRTSVNRACMIEECLKPSGPRLALMTTCSTGGGSEDHGIMTKLQQRVDSIAHRLDHKQETLPKVDAIHAESNTEA